MAPTQFWALWALAAGAGIPVMASLNGALARTLGNTPAAAAVLFLVGFLVCGLVLLTTGGASSLARLFQSPPSLFAGGLIVAFYILSVTHLAPRFGVANTILFVMVAQIVTSSLIDHFGVFGASQRPITIQRLAGLAIILAGLVLTQTRQATS